MDDRDLLRHVWRTYDALDYAKDTLPSNWDQQARKVLAEHMDAWRDLLPQLIEQHADLAKWKAKDWHLGTLAIPPLPAGADGDWIRRVLDHSTNLYSALPGDPQIGLPPPPPRPRTPGAPHGAAGQHS